MRVSFCELILPFPNLTTFPSIPDANRRSLAQLDDAIQTINRNISRFDQKIIEIDYALPGAEATYLTFVSTTESAINKLQSNWNAAEIELFRLMMREIVTSDESCRTLIQCMNMASEVKVKTITKAKAEAVIRKWINLGYFYELEENIYFGPRMITEFGTNLRTAYKDFVAVCNICKAIVFWGPHCGSCEEMFHEVCIEKYLSRINSCPACKENFRSPV